jgi:putative redox protein
MIVKTIWNGDMEFDSELNGHHMTIDANAEVGGHDKGPRPKGLLLTALTGCTGMDVVSILKKMKVDNYEFWLEADADQTSEHPKHYSKIYLAYNFKGQDLPVAKIKKAVKLSEDSYCGVSFMLKKAADFETKIFINGEEI